MQSYKCGQLVQATFCSGELVSYENENEFMMFTEYKCKEDELAFRATDQQGVYMSYGLYDRDVYSERGTPQARTLVL